MVENQFMDAHMILPSLAPSLHQPQHDSTDLDVLRKWIDENASAAEKPQEDDVVSAVASQFYILKQGPTPIPAEITSTALTPLYTQA